MSKEYNIVDEFGKGQKQGITLSHSSLSVMFKCHREYYYQYIAKIRVKDEKPWNAFGNMMHLIAENYSGDGQVEIKALFNCFKDDGKLKEKYLDKLDDVYRKKILGALKVLYKWFTNRWVKAEGYISEKQVDVYNIDNIDGVAIHLQGKLDGFYEIDGDIFISDFKIARIFIIF